MAIFSFVASNASKGMMKPRKLKAQFGGGYVQETGDGINPLLRTWNLTFSNIPLDSGNSAKTGLIQIDNFLTAQAGLPFQWTQPAPFDTAGLKNFVCEQWDWTYVGGTISGVTAVFEQRP